MINQGGKIYDIKKRVYFFAIKIIKLSNKFPRSLSSEIVLKQLLRSGSSIGANIIEAKASSSKKEFIKYYGIALKSGNESKFWLGLLRDSNLTKNQDILTEIKHLLEELNEITNILASIILKAKAKKYY
ncbi:MAG: four helix bundle protein [Patescibacteria group bacterium]|nr:four helix bundle protein [Patescibacteria group bacterium]